MILIVNLTDNDVVVGVFHEGASVPAKTFIVGANCELDVSVSGERGRCQVHLVKSSSENWEMVGASASIGIKSA